VAGEDKEVDAVVRASATHVDRPMRHQLRTVNEDPGTVRMREPRDLVVRWGVAGRVVCAADRDQQRATPRGGAELYSQVVQVDGAVLIDVHVARISARQTPREHVRVVLHHRRDHEWIERAQGV
jgi:hypothetical protein